MSTTELMLKTNFEGRVRRTLQCYYRRPNDVLLAESLVATGLTRELVDEVLAMLEKNFTANEIMDTLRDRNIFARDAE